MYSTILIPIDGSDEAHNGLEMGCTLAEHYKSKVILLCVTQKQISDAVLHGAVDEGLIQPASYQDVTAAVQYPEVTMSMAEENRQIAVEQVASVLAKRVVKSGKSFASEQHVPEVMTLIRDGDPADCITAVANSYDADLVVLGSHGRTGLDKFFHPGVAEYVRKHTKCSCLLLTPPHE